MWNNATKNYTVNPNCEVIDYNAYNTTCQCTDGSSSSSRYMLATPKLGIHHPNKVQFHQHRNRILKEQQSYARSISSITGEDYESIYNFNKMKRKRRLSDSGSSMSGEFASQADIVTGQFVERWTSIQSLSLEDIQRNIVIFAICLTLILSTVCGLGYFVFIDMKEIKISKENEEQEKTNSKLRKVYGFFNILLPDELAADPWMIRLWRKLLIEHDYFCMLMPYNKDRSLRSLKWVLGMAKILNFMFIDTILAGLFFDDGGKCETFTTKSDCLLTKSLDQMSPLCEWTPTAPGESTGTCSFAGPPDNDFFSQALLTMIITVFAVPLDKMIERCLDEVKIFVDALQVRTGGDIYGKDDIENQEMGDELKDVQTLQNTLLRAARLTKMMHEMDDVSPEDELDIMIESHSKIYHSVKANTNKMAISTIAANNYISDIESYSAIEMAKTGYRKDALNKIIKARKDAQYISQQLSLIEGEDAREIYLLQQFLCTSLKGIGRYIADKILFEHLETEEEMADKSFGRILTMLFIPMYFAFASLYIFLFGVSIGPKSTRFWLIGAIQAFAMDIFLLQPAKIWMNRIGISTVAGREIQKKHAVLRDRSVSIMRRTQGLMKYSSAFVQHFNPACRVARDYPELPAARLLMSLSDYDLPMKKSNKRTTIFTIFGSIFGSIGLVVMFVLILLPEFIQESAIELGVSAIVNGFVIVAFYLSQIQIAIPVGIFIFTCLYVAYYHNSAMKSQAIRTEKEEAELENKLNIILKQKPTNDSKVKTTSKVMGNILSQFNNMSTKIFSPSKKNAIQPINTNINNNSINNNNTNNNNNINNNNIDNEYIVNNNNNLMTDSVKVTGNERFSPQHISTISSDNAQQNNSEPLNLIGIAALPPQAEHLGQYKQVITTDDNQTNDKPVVQQTSWETIPIENKPIEQSKPENISTKTSPSKLEISPIAKRTIEVEDDDALDIRNEVTGNIETCKVKPLPPSVNNKNTSTANIEYLMPDMGISIRFDDEEEYS
eukprot:TRINITY_DN64308_c0_g1_i2.p1 TRINITY_DN64308_c0_g1~~TRINITY_DN64308_c0_g1_i2.p1  ORF type:complete len:1100 (-),score=0.54 TRINITY_DN64308_c0_g1_i2:178-3198(-)